MIRLSVIGHQCRLEITDNGQGFAEDPSAGGGLGLGNMRQRAEGLGGSFEVTHPSTGGTTIAWQVPAFPDRGNRGTGG
jgi:signal transduction histidine kinase